MSCNNSSDDNLSPFFDENDFKRVNILPYRVIGKPEIFETAFFNGTKLKQDADSINFYTADIGKLNVESGKLIACDPIGMHDAEPFLETFPTGHFPVQLAIAKFSNDERVAYSRILFSDSQVVRWEFALQDGQKPIPIDGEMFYGYGVDAGTGLFIDEKANVAFEKLSWEKVFFKEMEKNDRDTWSYILYSFGEHNLAAFSTGMGDGTYGTYIGFDSKGNICRLLTDFGLIEWAGK